ncbi:MAG: hypothetical protein JNL35_00895 [Sphingopyxis sp.]|nr:hypothetical protein [Sphingopyxis sp.]
MPRPRTLDPIGASDYPNIVEDPVRVAAIVASFIDRLNYLQRGCRFAKTILQSNQVAFNESLRRLKDQLARIDRGQHVAFERSQDNRLHPELELLINVEARNRAGVDQSAALLPEHQSHVLAAARQIASAQAPRRGRPGRGVLMQYLEGLVALIIEVTGKPVMAPRTSNSVYEPRLTGAAGQVIRMFADSVEPGLSDTTLVNMIGKIRRKNAGKEMKFSDLFPFYRSRVTKDGLELGAGYRVEASGIIFPIYCP